MENGYLISKAKKGYLKQREESILIKNQEEIEQRLESEKSIILDEKIKT